MSTPTVSDRVKRSYVRTYGEGPAPGAREFLQLSDHLETHRDTVLSIEILPVIPDPGDTSAVLVVDGKAVAIGKKDLIRAFVYARTAFFGHASGDGDGRGDAYIRACCSRQLTQEKARAARVLLLFDPEHLTAVNYLKKLLLASSSSTFSGDQPDLTTLAAELLFMDSLLSSPLHKHSKSPTLWSHRLWLVQTFQPWESLTLQGQQHSAVPSERKIHTAYKRAQFWRDERAHALKAASQHDKNYHAFLYLRRLWDLLWADPLVCAYHSRADVSGCETVLRVMRWCRRHPRDISAWSFLVWMCCRPQGGHNLKIIAYSQIVAVERFRQDLGWHGEAVDWFLEAMKKLSPRHFPKVPICQLRSYVAPARMEVEGDSESIDDMLLSTGEGDASDTCLSKRGTDAT